MSFKKQALAAVGWSFFGKTSVQIVRFGIGIVLARTLSPSDYGLLGMIAIFISVGDVLVDSGYGHALIQKKSIDNNDISTVFFINIIISSVLYLVLAFSSSYIANFFNTPILEQIVIIVSLSLIIKAFSITQATLLAKELKFKQISVINFITTIISGALGIYLALNDKGVWSLVWMSLSKDILFTTLLWFTNKWRPILTFNTQSAKNLFSFGSKILGIGLLDNFFLHLYSLVIGKFFTPADLGYYTRALGYRDLISKNISIIIQGVSFPLFSSINEDKRSMGINYLKITEFSFFVLTPLLLLLIFVAEPLIRLMITEKWLPVVPYLQVLCIAGLFYPLYSLQSSLLLSLGRSDSYFFLNIFHKSVSFVGILGGFRWGVLGFVIAQFIAIFLSIFIGFLYIKKNLQLNVFRQIKAIYPYLIICSLAQFFVFFILDSMVLADVLFVLLQSFFSITIYLFASLVFKLSGFFIALDTIRSKLRI